MLPTMTCWLMEMVLCCFVSEYPSCLSGKAPQSIYHLSTLTLYLHQLSSGFRWENDKNVQTGLLCWCPLLFRLSSNLFIVTGEYCSLHINHFVITCPKQEYKNGFKLCSYECLHHCLLKVSKKERKNKLKTKLGFTSIFTIY